MTNNNSVFSTESVAKRKRSALKGRRARAAASEIVNLKDCVQKVRILSIDGGGIRGILPATILNYIEKSIQDKTNNKAARLSDYFDLIAGSSTGGILTCAYLTPQANVSSKGRPMTAEQALNLYRRHGSEIFALPFYRKIETLFGVIDEKYSSTALKRLLKAKFGSKARLSEMLKPCLITAYDITNRRSVFFNQMSAKKKEAKDFSIWEVAQATSAAPTYFEPAKIKSEVDDHFPLVDGGIFANNPAMCAYIEAHKSKFSEVDNSRKMPDHPVCSDILMVSIGTGSVKRSYDYEKMKDKGIISWVKPVLDMMMSASSETVDFQLRQMFDTCQRLQGTKESNYYRLSPQLGDADSALDNVDQENLDALYSSGLQYVNEHKEQLDQIVNRLIVS